MSTLVLPRVQAMLLCDEIEESDQEADVVHLTGVRAVLDVPSFPAVYAQLCVFLHMSGHQGMANCQVKIEEVGSGDAIFETEILAVSFDDPASVVPVYFRLPNCVFPAPGLYYVQVLHESKLIGERPLGLRIDV